MDGPEMIPQQLSSRLAWWFMLIGFAIRIGIAAHAGLGSAPRLGSDASEYDSYAWNLAGGHGYRGISPDIDDAKGQPLDHPTAYRVPGTSLFWAGLYSLFGHRYAAVRVAGCVLDTLMIILVYRVAIECFDPNVALVSAAIYVVWPTAVFYASQLGSEPLYAFLFVGSLLACLQFAKYPGWFYSVAGGLLLGLAILVRANGIIMVPLLFAWSIWQFRKAKRLVVVQALSIPLLAMLVLVPWIARNYRTFHAFVPFDTSGGDVLLGSYNRITASDPLYYGYWVFPTSELAEYRKQIIASNDEVSRDRVERRLAIQWIENHRDKLLYLVESRFRRSLTPFLESRSPALFRIGMMTAWGPIVVFLALGFFPTLVFFLRAHNPGWIVHLGILHFVLTALVFWGASRFRYPVEGLCIILAVASFSWLWSLVQRRLSRETKLRAAESTP
jgi:4-amino-4-deoxy-L-arabinose transferase-like glycosyltransferase